VRQEYCSSNIIPYQTLNYQLKCNIANRYTNVMSEIRRTGRGQRAQIGDPESGRITSASPTGRPAQSAPDSLVPERAPFEKAPDAADLLTGLAPMLCGTAQTSRQTTSGFACD